MVFRPASARSGPARSGSSPGARSPGARTLASSVAELEVVLKGFFDRERFLAFVRHFIVFEDSGGGTLTKKMAGYHQFHAVNVAVEETLRASVVSAHPGGSGETEGRFTATPMPGGQRGDRRVGVVWHTQGSGKSLTMAFYAGRIILQPAMANPTVVVLTDRNDLDDQLFATFARCRDLLRQPPVQAANRADLREKLAVASRRRRVHHDPEVLPRGEGRPSPGAVGSAQHRGHRRRGAPQPVDFIDGFARHMRDALPNASFIGFTGTPIEQTDANTRAVFGDYISVYDIQRAVDRRGHGPDLLREPARQAGAEGRRDARRSTPSSRRSPRARRSSARRSSRRRWAQLEAVVGSENRIKLIARDLVEHFEDRLAAMDGKAMVVCMSRRICVELYREIAALRPAWHQRG